MKDIIELNRSTGLPPTTWCAFVPPRRTTHGMGRVEIALAEKYNLQLARTALSWNLDVDFEYGNPDEDPSRRVMPYACNGHVGYAFSWDFPAGDNLPDMKTLDGLSVTRWEVELDITEPSPEDVEHLGADATSNLQFLPEWFDFTREEVENYVAGESWIGVYGVLRARSLRQMEHRYLELVLRALYRDRRQRKPHRL